MAKFSEQIERLREWRDEKTKFLVEFKSGRKVVGTRYPGAVDTTDETSEWIESLTSEIDYIDRLIAELEAFDAQGS